MQFPDLKFNGLVRFFGGLVPHTLTASDYPDFAAMRADYLAHGRIAINVNNSNGTIFADPSVNWDFRAWHDMCHILTDGDFSPAGESPAMAEMLRQMRAHPGLTDSERDTFESYIRAEIEGQTAWYSLTGGFPSDQKGFAQSYLQIAREVRPKQDAAHIAAMLQLSGVVS
jgi:hypothetical protein